MLRFLEHDGDLTQTQSLSSSPTGQASGQQERGGDAEQRAAAAPGQAVGRSAARHLRAPPPRGHCHEPRREQDAGA